MSANGPRSGTGIAAAPDGGTPPHPDRGSTATTGSTDPTGPTTSIAEAGTGPAKRGPAAPDAPQAADAPPADRSRIRRRVLINVVRVMLLVVFVGLWQVLAEVGVIDKFYFGQPSGVWSQLVVWTTEGTSQGSLGKQVWVTLQETLLGFGIGTGLGIVCGILLGRLRLLADVFAPYIKTLNSIPRIVLGSVFAIWFGLGISSKVALSVVLVFFGVFFNAFQGAREVDGNLIANARILGAGRWKVTTQVVIPSALSWITTSMHIAFGFAVTGAIVGELLGAQQGIGLLISQAQGNFDPNSVYAGLVITAAVALAAEGLITLLERRVLHWHPRAQRSGNEL